MTEPHLSEWRCKRHNHTVKCSTTILQMSLSGFRRLYRPFRFISIFSLTRHPLNVANINKDKKIIAGIYLEGGLYQEAFNCPLPLQRKARGHSIRLSVRPSFRPSTSNRCMQLLLQFYSDFFKILQLFRSWSEDEHIVWI